MLVTGVTEVLLGGIESVNFTLALLTIFEEMPLTQTTTRLCNPALS